MKAADLFELLRVRYPWPEWLVLSEVRNATGYRHAARYADAIAVHFWPTRGLEIIGFEIKVSRSDFLQEMQKPEKAAAIARHCDVWYLVTPAGLVKPGEIPDAWGLLEATKTESKLRTQKLPREIGRGEYQPVDRAFFASLLREARKDVEEQIECGYLRGRDEGMKVADEIVGREKEREREVRQTLEELRCAIGSRDTRTVQEAVRMYDGLAKKWGWESAAVKAAAAQQQIERAQSALHDGLTGLAGFVQILNELRGEDGACSD